MTTERDDIGRAPNAAARADGRGHERQRRRTKMDSRRGRQRLILPGALGGALLVALLAGMIANQVGGPDLARVPAAGGAAPAPDYASDYGTEHDPFVIQSSRPRSAAPGDYRLSPPNEAEPAGDVPEAEARPFPCVEGFWACHEPTRAGAGETSPSGDLPGFTDVREDHRADGAAVPGPAEDRPVHPAALEPRGVPVQGPAWFDARDFAAPGVIPGESPCSLGGTAPCGLHGVPGTGQGTPDGDDGPCRDPGCSSCDR